MEFMPAIENEKLEIIAAPEAFIILRRSGSEADATFTMVIIIAGACLY